MIVWQHKGCVFLKQRGAEQSRMAEFWELPAPEDFLGSAELIALGEFEHTIVNTRFRVQVVKGSKLRPRAGGRWLPLADLASVPLTTVSRKALALALNPPKQ